MHARHRYPDRILLCALLLHSARFLFLGCLSLAVQSLHGRSFSSLCMYVCGDGGRVVIRLRTHPENPCRGAYQLLAPYTHGVPHVDCEGPSVVFVDQHLQTSTVTAA
jgi:hypothetical protein